MLKSTDYFFSRCGMAQWWCVKEGECKKSEESFFDRCDFRILLHPATKETCHNFLEKMNKEN